ncbi:MAG: GGDEF domain-containing protein [Fibrobacterota bacterium]
METAEITVHLNTFAQKMIDNFRELLGVEFHRRDGLPAEGSTLFEGFNVYISFTGTAQGSYILNITRDGAFSIVADVLDEADLTVSDVVTSGVIDEILNTSVGQAIEDLKKSYGFLTFNPPVINYGLTRVAVFDYATTVLTGEYGDVICHFSISPVSLDITEKLINTMNKLRDTEKLANIDSLTGLKNRLFFDDYVKHFNMHRALPFAIAMIDLDDFKSINDGYGHRAGDEALKHLARILEDSTRDSDLPIRYGGDEFFLIMENTPEEGAAIVLQRVCRKLAAVPVCAGVNEFHISVSVGIATLRSTDRAFSALFERSDGQLYRAKEQGKACVCVNGRVL